MQVQSQTSSPSAVTRALRPARAGHADTDRHAVRAALRRVLDEHKGDAAKLRRAGYSSSDEFSGEIDVLLRTSGNELTPKLLNALFAAPGGAPDAPCSGRLGRLLGIG